MPSPAQHDPTVGPRPAPGEHDASAYGAFVAEDYDVIYDGVFDTEAAVAVIADLAEGGSVLEFGVGTGRVALPLAAKGLEVTGIDGSAAMLALLREKPGGDRVRTVEGDFSEVDAGGPVSLVALTFNTVFALPDQDAQVRCFANAARHLEPGGRFVVEAWVPDLAASASPTLQPRRVAPGLVGLVVAEHDRARQILSTTQIVLGGPIGVRVYPVNHRYAHPGELDLMARLAGMELEVRWADWHRTPYTSTSPDHISVYRRGR